MKVTLAIRELEDVHRIATATRVLQAEAAAIPTASVKQTIQLVTVTLNVPVDILV